MVVKLPTNIDLQQTAKITGKRMSIYGVENLQDLISLHFTVFTELQEVQ